MESLCFSSSATTLASLGSGWPFCFYRSENLIAGFRRFPGRGW